MNLINEEHLNRTELVFDRSILLGSSAFVLIGVFALGFALVGAGQPDL